MMRFTFLAALLLLCGAGVAEEAPNAAVEVLTGQGRTPPALTLESSAADVLVACREMLPVRPVELKGALIMRNRKGIVSSEHGYRLVMRRGKQASVLTIHLTPRGATNEIAAVTITRKTGSRPVIRLTRDGGSETEVVESPLSSVLETDVTWLDLTFDFLWWQNASFEKEREDESIHGQKCLVIFVTPDIVIEGLAGVRLWVDKKTGCLMQAEQVGPGGKSLRRLWGTRVKKFDGKWMASVIEEETPGMRRRTKITVEELREL